MRIDSTLGPVLVILTLAIPTLASPSVLQAAPPGPVKVMVPVQGLGADQVPGIERELRALEAGPETKRVKVLEEVAIDMEEDLLELSIAPGQELSFAQVERILTNGKTRVLRDKLRIADARLSIEGETTDELIASLKRGLTEGGLFKSAELKRQEKPPLLLAEVRGGTEKPTYDSVAKLIQGASEALRLKDLVWAAPARS